MTCRVSLSGRSPLAAEADRGISLSGRPAATTVLAPQRAAADRGPCAQAWSRIAEREARMMVAPGFSFPLPSSPSPHDAARAPRRLRVGYTSSDLKLQVSPGAVPLSLSKALRCAAFPPRFPRTHLGRLFLPSANSVCSIYLAFRSTPWRTWSRRSSRSITCSMSRRGPAPALPGRRARMRCMRRHRSSMLCSLPFGARRHRLL